MAAWLSTAAADGRPLTAMTPDLLLPERALAQVEGRILGVSREPSKKPNRTVMSTAKVGRANCGGKTTQPSYVHKNGHEVRQATDLPGNDHNQVVYLLRCGSCGHRYGAKGSDTWLRKCPACRGGAMGLAF